MLLVLTLRTIHLFEEASTAHQHRHIHTLFIPYLLYFFQFMEMCLINRVNPTKDQSHNQESPGYELKTSPSRKTISIVLC